MPLKNEALLFHTNEFISGHALTRSISNFSRLDALHYHEPWLSRVWSLSYALFLAFALNTLSLTLLKLSFEVHAISLMKPLEFPIEGEYPLNEAMKQRKEELLQYLAFSDFVDLAKSDKNRRNDLFQLTQPGGHPKNWLEVSRPVLEVIHDFMADLNASAAPTAANPIPKVTSTSDYNGNGLRQRIAKSAAGVNAHAQSEPTRKLGLVDMVVKRVMNSPLFAIQPEAENKAVFARSQVIIWAVEALSQMTSASIFEDNYGVVQNNLAEIINTLLTLQQVVHKLPSFL